MSRWDLLCLCVFIANDSCTPLELLWWDNHLTLLGALTVISFEVSILNNIFILRH